MMNDDTNRTTYPGPSPKSINTQWPDHSYDKVVCLINGEPKNVIMPNYLATMGWSREDYKIKFPSAPLTCQRIIDARRNPSEKTKEARRERLRNLNKNKKFQENRNSGVKRFWLSSESAERRVAASENAKEQHRRGLAEHVKKYFNERFEGSADQLRRRQSIIDRYNAGEIFTSIKSQTYEAHADLYYTSSYEKHFLDYLRHNDFDLTRVKNGPCFVEDDLFYISDYIIDERYVVEIKSEYIELLQESRRPGSLELKRAVVEERGFTFVYVRDKDYIEISTLFHLG